MITKCITVTVYCEDEEEPVFCSTLDAIPRVGDYFTLFSDKKLIIEGTVLNIYWESHVNLDEESDDSLYVGIVLDGECKQDIPTTARLKT